MKKVGVICLVLLIALTAMGTSYATWTQNLSTSATTVAVSSLSVTTNNADGFSTTGGATLHGTLNGLGGYTSPVGVSFQYGKTNSYGSTTGATPSSFVSIPPGSFSASLSGLDTSTLYHFRSIANGYFTKYGNDNTFTTWATTNINPSQDAYLNDRSSEKNTNYGASTKLNVGKVDPSSQDERAVIQFDLSSLSGKTIESATLWLYATSVSKTNTYEIHLLLNSWTESGVTWNNRDASNSWSPVGGNYLSNTTANLSINTQGWKSWTVTSDVQSFVSGTLNAGWIILDHSTNDGGVTFSSKESSTNKPYLIIIYH